MGLPYDNNGYGNDNHYQTNRKVGNSMSLAMIGIGEIRRVSEFRGKDEMKKHLRDLGFIKGERVQVIGENPSGLILMIKGVKIALNRGLASMIMVE